MNNGLLTYKLPLNIGLTRHGELQTPLLGDWNMDSRLTQREEVDVQVRSGDYFVTLATVLDGLIGSVDSYMVRSELEDIVSSLIYLQDNYTITKNTPSK